jgi:hypothetical protein
MSDHSVLIKCLHSGGRSVHSFKDAQGQHGWDLPHDGQPGAWKGPVEGTLKPHHNGLHLAKKDFLIDWLTGHHYLAEPEGETVEGLDCVIARKARLVKPLPVNGSMLQVFCNNELSMLPKILQGLTVYPKISKDVEACVNAIHENGLGKADKSLDRMPEYKHIRLNYMRFQKDALHSIEYNQCTQAAIICLGTVISAHDLMKYDANIIDTTKIISNKVAKTLECFAHNYHFMAGLVEQGYDHQNEVISMAQFLNEQNLETSPTPAFFQHVRMRQNNDILPALGFSS